MNSKERVENTFTGKENDLIPVNHRGFSSRTATYILGREAFVGGGIQQWREAKSLYEGWHDEYLERSFADAVEISRLTNQDIIRPEYWRASQKPTRKIDEYTYLYEYGDESEWKVLRFDPASEQANFFKSQPRELTLAELKKEVAASEKSIVSYQPSETEFAMQIKAQKIYGKDFVIEVGGIGIGIPIREANLWLEAMLLDPELVKTLIAQQVEKARRAVEFLAGYGFRYFLGGGDFASEKGPIYSPRLFAEMILPGLQAVSDICHQNDSYHLFASDGNLWPVAGFLFGESKIDCYYEIDRRAGMDLEKLRKEFPEVTLIGNISSHTLARGKKEDVKKEVLSCLKVAKEYKGVIVGVSNYILPETPPENIDVLLETISSKR